MAYCGCMQPPALGYISTPTQQPFNNLSSPQPVHCKQKLFNCLHAHVKIVEYPIQKQPTGLTIEFQGIMEGQKRSRTTQINLWVVYIVCQALFNAHPIVSGESITCCRLTPKQRTFLSSVVSQTVLTVHIQIFQLSMISQLHINNVYIQYQFLSQ